MKNYSDSQLIMLTIASTVLGCSLILGMLATFSEQNIVTADGQQIIENLPEIPVVKETYIIPDPCALDSVVCEGEEAEPKQKESSFRTVTAYTSYANQTDSSPCISADGSNICDRYAAGEQICASNDYPMGSKLHVARYGTCTVADRMNSRYTGTGRVDVYFGYDTEKALDWGIRWVIVTKVE